MEKTYNVMRKKENEKKKKTNPLLIFVGIALVVMIVSLFYISIISTQINENETDKNGSELANLESNEKYEFASYFFGCDLLDSKCLDLDCAQYFLCNDQEYQICEVYDCGVEFGVGTKDKNGEINIERVTKENREKIIKTKSKCSGSLEIIESNSVDEKLEAKVKVTTSGDCAISGFLVSCQNLETNKNSSFKPAKFSNLDDGFYSISISNCVEIAEIIAVGENGINIK